MIVAVGKITLASTSPIHVPRPNGSGVARCQVGGKLSYERRGITVIPAGLRWWWEGGGGGQEWGESGNRSSDRRETQGSFVPVFSLFGRKKMITKRHRRFQFFILFFKQIYNPVRVTMTWVTGLLAKQTGSHWFKNHFFNLFLLSFILLKLYYF